MEIKTEAQNTYSFWVALKIVCRVVTGRSWPCALFSWPPPIPVSKEEPGWEPGSGAGCPWCPMPRTVFHLLVSKEEENKNQPLRVAKTGKHLHDSMGSSLLLLFSSLLGRRSLPPASCSPCCCRMRLGESCVTSKRPVGNNSDVVPRKLQTSSNCLTLDKLFFEYASAAQFKLTA